MKLSLYASTLKCWPFSTKSSKAQSQQVYAEISILKFIFILKHHLSKQTTKNLGMDGSNIDLPHVTNCVLSACKTSCRHTLAIGLSGNSWRLLLKTLEFYTLIMPN